MRMSLIFPIVISIVFANLVSSSHGLNQPSSLVTTSTKLTYHKGPLLTSPSTLNIYIIWYGSFSIKHKTTITYFLASFSHSTTTPNLRRPPPTVSTWWKTIQAYKDVRRRSVSNVVKLVHEVADVKYSLGKNLKRAHIALLVKKMILNKAFSFDPSAIYFVLTAHDVSVEKFCMSSCGFHESVLVSPGKRVVYAHVGDPGTQCPDLCAWPYAVPAYGPPGKPLVAPNGIGIDGMIMNVATVLAGASTNPFKNGYFQGDALAPLEAVTACPGVFGEGAYPGYPGKLMVDRWSKASYNSLGMGRRVFLLPAMWDPLSSTCKFVG